ncbi:MAG: hypothetical protein EDX89_08535 [Acidobacteria bacterium]|nr:MAG: hypothetical protein EDX89_08535 [Acidobacteriota bacterium]
MAVQPVIPERDYQATLDFLREYDLERHIPNLKGLRETAGLPGPQQAHAWEALNSRLVPFREYHETRPFRIPPRGCLGTSASSFLRVIANNDPIPWDDYRAPRHTIILGPTGSGKSTLNRHVVTAAKRAQKVVKAWDLKGDLADFAINNAFLIVGPETVLVLLARVSYLSAAEQASVTSRCFARSFFMADRAPQVLLPSLMALWSATSTPSIKDLYETVLTRATARDTFNQRDAVRQVAQRLSRLMVAYPSMSTATHGLTLESLNTMDVHLGGTIHTDATAFLMLLQSAHLYAWRRSSGRREWTTVIVGDEANYFAGETGNTIDGESLYHEDFQLFREFGVNMTLASSSRLDSSIVTNAGTIIVLGSPQDADYHATLLRLTSKQRDYLARMPQGECLVRLAGYPDVIHAGFDPIIAEKYVPPATWHAAQRRHNPEPTPDHTTPPIATSAVTSHAMPPPTPALPTSEHGRTLDKPVIALHHHEDALLRVVCDGVTASTPAYKKAALSLADGDQAAKRLAQKDLIVRERITLHAGRGGHGVGLAPTPSGLSRAGKDRPVKTRGGDSVQHQYLIQELHRHLPASTVEAMVGTKSVDLLIALNTTRDAPLWDYVRPFLPARIALNDGDLVAIEVETSAPEKTAPNNALKNHDAGITLTIIAVLPKTMVATRRSLNALPAIVQDHTLLVNVLDLLRALPSGAGGRESPS